MKHYHPLAQEMEGAAVDTGQDLAALVDQIVTRARVASRFMATCPTRRKNNALLCMAASFRGNATLIQAENAKDLEAGRAAGLGQAMLDRLELTDKRIEGMAQAAEEIAALDDPVGEIEQVRTRPNGLRVGRMRSPIGVIGIIYESRPNVTSDAGCLCLKSGNAVVLRGGKEAFHSNTVIARLMDEAARQVGLPEGCVQLVPTTDRAAVSELLRRNDCVDLIIPRGGRGLIEMVVNNSLIPVIKHYDGNCFVYVDKAAEPLMAMEIVTNSKTQRTGVCNAAESLLLHKDVAASLGCDIIQGLIEKGVEVRADAGLRDLLTDLDLKEAGDEDWRTEYLDMIITAGVTGSAAAAAAFINAHGSHHTDAIVTNDHPTAMGFLAAVDSACVFINCSTRFSDGGQFGLGAEIGISTDKLHARGPMGLRDLTTLKYVVFGQGQVRES